MIDTSMTPREAAVAIKRCMNARLVPFLRGSPGIAKSSVAYQIAEEGNLEMLDVRLSQATPEDLQGLPMRKTDSQGVERASFVPFEMFPIQGTPLPPGKNGWLLFLDEFNSANKSVQAASYKIVLDRMVGQYRLHDNVWIVCAGNLDTDRAITNPLSTAMQSRLIHLEMQVSKDDWMEWANTRGQIDFRVIGFIAFQPQKLYAFDPDHEDKTFACPRTWEFVSRLIQGEKDLQPMMRLLAGTISPGIAVEFIRFCEEYGRIPKLADILKDPNGTPVPKELSTRFATLTYLVEYIDKSNHTDLLAYIRRFPEEEQVLFLKTMFLRSPELRVLPGVAQMAQKIIRFAHA